MHDLFEPVSRDERQAQALKAWIKAKGHGTIVGCTGFGFYKYKLYEFFKDGSRSVQEWAELSSSKIGGGPVEGNTEVIEEIKESSTPYSIENEPNE